MGVRACGMFGRHVAPLYLQHDFFWTPPPPPARNPPSLSVLVSESSSRATMSFVICMNASSTCRFSFAEVSKKATPNSSALVVDVEFL